MGNAVTKALRMLSRADTPLAKAAQGLGSTTSREAYHDLVNELKPVRPYTSVPTPATVDQLLGALHANKRGKVGKGSEIAEGQLVGLRLDIPAYTEHNVWAPTIHDTVNNNRVLAHEPAAHVTSPVFDMSHSKALAVAKGGAKNPFATINGGWKPTTPEEAHALAQEALDHPDWRQVGMDPERHSYFYDRHTQEPIVSAEEAVQVGPLVLAKKPVYGNKDDYPFNRGGRAMADGGPATSTGGAPDFIHEQLFSGEPQLPQTNRDVEGLTEDIGNAALKAGKMAAYLHPATRGAMGVYDLAHGAATGNPAEVFTAIGGVPSKMARAIGAGAFAEDTRASDRPEMGGGGDAVRKAMRMLGKLYPEGAAGYTPPRGMSGVIDLKDLGRVQSRPIEPIMDVAESYRKARGLTGAKMLDSLVPINKEFSGRVAGAYGDLRHDPNDPSVKRAYDALIEETMDQLRAAKPLGISYEFVKPTASLYEPTPALGYHDILTNRRMGVFPTAGGFGTLNEAEANNPLLRSVGRIGNLRDATANDAFRIVHDLYGHYGPGNAFFRGPGEERAYQLHSKMYSPEALPAAAAETRGQNSWVNYGPHAEHNRTASGSNTIYADQKTGMMPEWSLASPPEEGADVDAYIRSLGGMANGGGAWTRKEGKNPNGGLNEKGRASLRAQGHDIKRPQPEGGSRRDSFCARMKGMKAKLTSSETANDPDSRINKSLRAWNCADGGKVWDKPRPKGLGKPKHLSSAKKAKAKAMAKAAGRPYPNLVDNMRAARADGGHVGKAMRMIRKGLEDGGTPSFDESGSMMVGGYGEDVPQKTAHDFVQQQLNTGEPQLPQMDREARDAWKYGAPKMAAHMAAYEIPGVGQALAGYDAANAFRELASPEVREQLANKNYMAALPALADAGLSAMGLGGSKALVGAGALGTGLLASDEAEAGPIGSAMKIARKFVKNPVRVTRPEIYSMSPSEMADIAESNVAPESPALKRLFGVTRGEMNEIAGARPGTAEPSIMLKDNARGSEAAKNVMTPRNAQRMIDILAEANKRPNLSTGMRPWYYMDPAYNRMVDLMGPDAAEREYHRLNTSLGVHSPGAPVPTEINRGLGAYFFGTPGNNYGNIQDYIKYGGDPATAPAVFQGAAPGLLGHPYHSTSHGLPLGKFYATGEHGMQSPKAPLYIQASGSPRAFQTTRAVPDAHYTRIVGLPDTRGAQSKASYDASMSMPEYTDIGPWWEKKIAKPAGMEAVPAQALTWGAGSHLTGVDTPIGAPKLELLADHIMQRAAHHGVSPERARDLILQGRMYKRGGKVEGALRLAHKISSKG